MAHIASLLDPADMSAIGAWLASQPAPSSAPLPNVDAAKLPMECGSVTAR
jgi:hypothetical protein